MNMSVTAVVAVVVVYDVDADMVFRGNCEAAVDDLLKQARLLICKL